MLHLTSVDIICTFDGFEWNPITQMSNDRYYIGTYVHTRAVGARCYKWANENALTVLRSNASAAGCRQKEGSIQQRYLPLSLSLPFLLLYPPTRVYRKYAPTTFAHTHTRRKENITVREMISTQVPRRHLPVLQAEAVGSSLMSYGNGRSFPPLVSFFSFWFWSHLCLQMRHVIIFVAFWAK